MDVFCLHRPSAPLIYNRPGSARASMRLRMPPLYIAFASRAGRSPRPRLAVNTRPSNMLSPRFLALAAALVTLATAASLPTDNPVPRPVTTITDVDVDDAPWFSFPLFGNLFAPLWRLFPTFADIGPRIIADDKKFQVIVNVKDYKKDDLKVKIKKELIFVQGSHEAKQEDRDVYASQFFHTYSLPVNSSSSAVTAELSKDGFLIITAPIDESVDKSKDADRDVPIVETGAPYQKEEPTTVAAGSTTEDDKREPTTTPAAISDVTGQDKKDNENEIPL